MLATACLPAAAQGDPGASAAGATAAAVQLARWSCSTWLARRQAS